MIGGKIVKQISQPPLSANKIQMRIESMPNNILG